MFFPPAFQILWLGVLAGAGWGAALRALGRAGIDGRAILELDRLPAGRGGGGGGGDGSARLAALVGGVVAAGWALGAWAAPAQRPAVALGTYVGVAAVLALPRRTAFHVTRRQLGALLGRVAWPSLRAPVYLADVVMADVLTSCARPLAGLAPVACEFAAALSGGGGGGGSPRTCPAGGAAAAVVLGAAPFAFRLRQCVNEMLKAPAGGPDARRHMANAAKYALAFPALALGARQQQARAQAQSGAAPGRGLWIAASAANSLYSLYWDVAFDWDLGHAPGGWRLADLVARAERPDPPPPGQRRAFPLLLRPRLGLGPPALYYAAVALDLALRLAWVASLGPAGRAEYADFWLAALELYRRWQWTVLRIEREAVAGGAQ
ncbi:protein-ER retention protein [Coemansia javaensis]|uniref:Protein-ER retention protein n=1 Tax=Coemansia javaensis TaxID=2761396 RepID=A0A9W8LM79_9FUNG|nr:protein-ER retention protein [Coemansia javaensis]